MVGFILIPIFSGGAYLMYWGTRTNISFMDAFYEKLGIPTNAETEAFIANSTEWKVKEFAKNDEQFNQLLKRFHGYLRGISGGGQFGVRQALDLNSGGINYVVYYIVLSSAIVPFLIAWLFTSSYIESIYQADFYDVMKLARTSRPDWVLGIVAVIILLLLFVIYKMVRLMTVKILGPILNMGNNVLSTEKTDPWNTNFKAFMNEKHQQINIPLYAYVYPMLIFCSCLPLFVGLVLLDSILILAGSVGLSLGLFLSRFAGGKGSWFRFKDANTLIVGKGLYTKTIRIAEIEEAIVHYQSIKNNSIQISSEAALMRSLISRSVINELMDSPELIPSTMTFFTQTGNSYVLPLRYINQNSKEAYSHEIEFFFAYWLKSNGFSFEIAERNEDAGDWRAYKN